MVPRTARPAVGAYLTAACLASMDPTTLSVAGPDITAALHASLAEAQWIVNAFLLALSVLLIASGTASRRRGEITMLRFGSALFAAGALCSTLAPSALTLIVARAVQGAGAAAMIPATIALYRASFPPERQGAAMAVYAGACTAAATVGPLLAGLVLSLTSWRAIFLAVGLAAIALRFALRHRTVAPREVGMADGLRPSIQVALAIGLLGVVWALIQTGSRGWSDGPVDAVLVGGAAVVGATLAVLARGASSGRAPARGFAPERIAASALLVVLASVGVLGTIFLMSTFLQRAHGYSPLQVALALVPCLATSSLLMPFGGRLGERLPVAVPVAGGLGCHVVALLLLARSASHQGGYGSIGPALVLLGAGTAFIVPTLLNGLLASASSEHGALMGAVNLSTNQLGGLLGVALLGAIAAGGLAPRATTELVAAGVDRPAAQRIGQILGAEGPSAARGAARSEGVAAATAERATRVAYAVTTARALRGGAFVAAITIALVVTLRRRLRPGEAVHATMVEMSAF